MKKLIFALVCAASFQTQASFIAMSDRFDFVRDANGTELDWLNLTYNEGRLFSDILADTEVGGIYDGWRLATRSEFNGLLSSAGYNASSDPYSNNYNITPSVPTGLEAYSLSALINMLGDTWESYINRTSSLTLVNGDQNEMWSWGILADDIDTDNYYLGLLSQGEHQFLDGAGNLFGATDLIPYYSNAAIQDLIHYDTQSAYLVRDIPVALSAPIRAPLLLPVNAIPAVTNPIPEPSAIALISSCLALLLAIRSRHPKRRLQPMVATTG
ncbi:hypothetical protein K0504_16460 [Neiella marina]|uniref:PEP-CTERM protein-sorting domain-containing protein n=1 Tax=Neiella holothuriorum TaxID=2870530 RepID=A0ABS7EJU8_9GAMM|nr:hypothetical protein [Neiella holothuriorum]MBW8192632.1 hypothetical protein [Neiella holothuriorum]